MPALAGVISIQPATFNPGVGQTFSLDVTVNGAADWYAYQFDIGFNSAVLSANSVSEGAFLSGAGSTSFFEGFIDNTGGTISFVVDSLIGPISGASGDGTLASISFTSIGAGVSPVGAFNVTVLDSFGEGIAVDTAGGTVTVSAGEAVPEPSSAFFLLGGSLALLALRRASRHP
jgi:general secretion pathway protein D